MSAAVANQKRTVPGAAFDMPTVVTGDTSYPAGGYAFTPASFGFTRISRISSLRANNIASAVSTPVIEPNAAGDYSSFKLRLVVATTGVEVATGQDMSARSYLFTIEGH
ncbi:MAG: hypothetical protein JWQ49_114 [Edaphobacter sp.]|nr:hypothetical protein [Edaphobacter sp.]